MVTKVIEIKSDVLRKALENPNKNFLFALGNYNVLCHEFAVIADEVIEKLGDMPIMINKQRRTITMPEGGVLMFHSFQYSNDVDKIRGYDFVGYELHDSFLDILSNIRHVAMHVIRSRIRQS